MKAGFTERPCFHVLSSALTFCHRKRNQVSFEEVSLSIQKRNAAPQRHVKKPPEGDPMRLSATNYRLPFAVVFMLSFDFRSVRKFVAGLT
jgi:hypothetical protein